MLFQALARRRRRHLLQRCCSHLHHPEMKQKSVEAPRVEGGSQILNRPSEYTQGRPYIDYVYSMTATFTDDAGNESDTANAER